MNQEFTGVIEYLSLGINIFSDFRRLSDLLYSSFILCREAFWADCFSHSTKIRPLSAARILVLREFKYN